MAGLDAAALPRRRWIVPGRFLVGAVTLTVAPPGASKTTLALAECIQVAAGIPWAGRSVAEPGPVLYLGGEDDADEIRRRLAAVAQAMGVALADVADRIEAYAADERPMGVNLARPGLEWGTSEAGPDVEAIQELAKTSEVKLVVIDPLIEFHELDENSNVAVKAVGRVLRAIARHAQCAVHATHHTPKPGQGGARALAGDMAAARGATALVGAARVMHTLMSAGDQDTRDWGIEAKDHGRFARLDMAKSNSWPWEPEPRWFRRDAVELANGEWVGVLQPVDLSPGAAEAQARLAERRRAIVARLLAVLGDGADRITVNKAGLALLAQAESLWPRLKGRDFKGRCPQRVRDEIEEAATAGTRVGGRGFTLLIEASGDRGVVGEARLLVLAGEPSPPSPPARESGDDGDRLDGGAAWDGEPGGEDG